ncbi:DUF4398 domain-containing protein [Thermodesulfatator autotrophicus]|uniref:DUF4398 domain-containing protein n=1 Tax=Thermodesulfatator autotrophicus TaxID=1795632 RepID=A0A177E7C8_9BACT|nr:DUF4398 domain-containing protein [Thermodesulfatator autotrophicus]OAG27853.1 hypothetical protein TH606_04795 [Thermodesulfatator autotrophicus]
MLKFLSHIVNFKQSSKTLFYILIFLVFTFTTGFKISEKFENILERIPYLNKLLEKDKPPYELLKKTEKSLNDAFWQGAPQFAPDSWEKAQEYFKKAQKFMEEKNYSYAKFYLQKSLEWAQKAQKEALETKKKQRKEAENKLKKLLALHPEIQRDLKWKPRLKLLQELIKYEKFEEFEKELKKIQQELKKKGAKPPSQNLS